jgi:predicted regulator of Ras-like GTPase activity (Roadblock/LC7/MglB family)
MNDDHRAPAHHVPKRPLHSSLFEGALEKLCSGNQDIRFALIATRDARVVGHQCHGANDPDRLAAMTSSVLAICESLSAEVNGGNCQSVSLTMRDCTVVIAHIPSPHFPLSLAIGVRNELMLARARRMTLDLADRIAASLNAPAA